MNKYLLMLLLLLAGSGCQQPAQTDASAIDQTAEKILAPFFNSLKNSESSSRMLEKLLGSNSNITVNDSVRADIERKLDFIRQSSGAYVSARMVKKQGIGDDVMAYSYIIKYKVKFYRFIFVFYNNGESVKLYKFSFDEEVNEELESGMKFYMD